MGGAIRFNHGKFAKILTKTATGTLTLTAFYDAANGTLFRAAVPAATQNTPTWESADPPEFTLTSGGGECYGAIFHLRQHSPTSFVVVVERIASGGSAPATGDMNVTWVRRGRSA